MSLCCKRSRFPIRTVDGLLSPATGGEYTNPAKRRIDDDVFEGKMRAATELDNLVTAGEYVGNSGPEKRHPEFPGGFDLYRVVFEVSGQRFEGTLNIGITENGQRRLYDMTKIKSLGSGSGVKQYGSTAAPTSNQGSSDLSVTESDEVVNIQYVPTCQYCKTYSPHTLRRTWEVTLSAMT